MNKLRKALAVAGVGAVLASGGVSLDLATAPPAEAAANRICHQGAYNQHAVVVRESDGSTYLLYPGKCTPGDVPITGFRPDGSAWQARYSHNFGTYTSTYRAGQWTSTLGYNVYIISVSRTGFGGGGSF